MPKNGVDMGVMNEGGFWQDVFSKLGNQLSFKPLDIF